MIAITDKYKYYEAMGYIKDDSYDEEFKEPYRLRVKEYLNNNYKQINQ